MTEVVEASAAELDFGSVFKLPESHSREDAGEWVKMIGYTRPMEYGPGVIAYANLETGEYQGMYTTNSEHSETIKIRFEN